MALVVAARVMGYFFHQRQRDQITVTTPRGEMVFEILHVVEFTSDRKKMSVIVRVRLSVYALAPLRQLTDVNVCLVSGWQGQALFQGCRQRHPRFAAEGRCGEPAMDDQQD